MSNEKTSPALTGEELEAIERALSHRCESWVPGHQRFMFVVESRLMAHICAALREALARAERAEKIAAAERALRKALEAYPYRAGLYGSVPLPRHPTVVAALAVLRALGVEP